MIDNWKPSRDKFHNETIPLLRKVGKRIGAISKEDEQADRIIKKYAMLERSFDPLTADTLHDDVVEIIDRFELESE